MYVAHVADVYKTALHDAVNGQRRLDLYLQELAPAASRPLTTGFFFGAPKLIPPATAAAQFIFAQLDKQIAIDKWQLKIKRKWQRGANIKLMLPGLWRPTIAATDYTIENCQGESLEIVNPGIEAYLRLEHPALVAGMFLLL